MVEVLAVSKRLRPAGSRGREAAGEVTVRHTGFEAGAPDVLVKETGVETVAGSDRVYRVHLKRRQRDPLGAAPGRRAEPPEFHGQHRHEPRRPGRSPARDPRFPRTFSPHARSEGGCPRRAGAARRRSMSQRSSGSSLVSSDVVRARLFHPAEQLRDPRAQRPVQEIGGQVEVLRPRPGTPGRDPRSTSPVHGAGIGQDVSVGGSAGG